MRTLAWRIHSIHCLPLSSEQQSTCKKSAVFSNILIESVDFNAKTNGFGALWIRVTVKASKLRRVHSNSSAFPCRNIRWYNSSRKWRLIVPLSSTRRDCGLLALAIVYSTFPSYPPTLRTRHGREYWKEQSAQTIVNCKLNNEFEEENIPKGAEPTKSS